MSLPSALHTTTIDMREIVLANSAFGPREIDQISRSIAEDYSQFGILRDAVAELETRARRLLLHAWPLQAGH